MHSRFLKAYQSRTNTISGRSLAETNTSGHACAGAACAIAGLVAIIRAKIFTGAQHMYAVHAWTGTVVLAGFFVQYVAGLVVFVLARERFSPKLRATAAKWHSALGRMVLFGGIGACVNG